MLMVRGTPESKAPVQGSYTFGTKGVVTFMIAMVALQVLTTQGGQFGWTNPIALGLIRQAAAAGQPDPTRDAELVSVIGSMPMSTLAAFNGMSIDRDALAELARRWQEHVR